MKRIFTLFFVSMLCLVVTASAQINETFEGANRLSTLTANCWTINTLSVATESINGQSIKSTTSGVSDMATPFVDLNGTANVSIQFLINNNLNGSRTIEIGTKDKNGTITFVSTNTYVKGDLKTNTVYTLNANISSITPVRIYVRFAGSGDGNTYFVIDNFTISNVSYHYSSFCNTAPTANNDTYFSVMPNPVSGNVITNTNGADTDNDNETLSASLVTAPASGALTLNTDGSFLYKPAAGFAGGIVTFTYMITDNGYEAKTATASVTINYAVNAAMPVHVTSFSANATNNTVDLSWTADDNETGNYFEIEKSSGDNKFKTIAIVSNTKKGGTETYSYKDATDAGQYSNYRLKIVNKDNTISYSKIVAFKAKTSEATSSLALLQNPITSAISFNYTATAGGVYTTNVYSATGLLILSKQITFQKGTNATSLAVNNNLPGGTYILEVIGNTERSTVKVAK